MSGRTLSVDDTPSMVPPDRLTVFAFLWACQALVHQEFYNGWVDAGDWAGWLLTVVAVAVFLAPSRLPLFGLMLGVSILYNVRKWPFVVNHILMESVVDAVMLGAILWTLVEARGRASDADARDRIFARFAPVLMAALVVMYYFAVVAKFNSGFVDTEVSCVTAMYDDLLRRAPFLPNAPWAWQTAIFSTLAIEVAIPVLLTFRRTQWMAIAIGMPFHLMLGLIGHRTFSALAYALYALFIIDELTPLAGDWRERLAQRLGPRRLRVLGAAVGVGAVTLVAGLVTMDATGSYRAGIGPLRAFRVPWIVWMAWSLGAMLVYGAAIRRMLARGAGPRAAPAAKPGLLWAALSLVVLNGLSQYLGLKTETAFTMYSNLRTEGGVNNHWFMPALRLADYQDDLVEIVSTDHPDLSRLVDEQRYLTHFELRRVVSTAERDFEVVYRRDGSVHRFERREGVASDPELAEPLDAISAKLLYFRPVPMSDRVPCAH